MNKEPCYLCSELNEPDATECAHCGARIIDIGDIDLLGKPIVFKMHLGNNITATQAYLPRLEIGTEWAGVFIQETRSITFTPIYTVMCDETVVTK